MRANYATRPANLAQVSVADVEVREIADGFEQCSRSVGHRCCSTHSVAVISSFPESTLIGKVSRYSATTRASKSTLTSFPIQSDTRPRGPNLCPIRRIPLESGLPLMRSDIVSFPASIADWQSSSSSIRVMIPQLSPCRSRVHTPTTLGPCPEQRLGKILASVLLECCGEVHGFLLLGEYVSHLCRVNGGCEHLRKTLGSRLVTTHVRQSDVALKLVDNRSGRHFSGFL